MRDRRGRAGWCIMKRRKKRAMAPISPASVPAPGSRLFRFAIVPAVGVVALSLLSIHHARETTAEPPPAPSYRTAPLEEAFDAYERATLAGDARTQAASAARIRSEGRGAADALGRRLAAAAGSASLAERYVDLASEMGAVDVLAGHYRSRAATDTHTRELLIGGISTSASSESIPTLESLYRYEASAELRSSIEGGLAAAGAPASRIAALRAEPTVAERTLARNLDVQARAASARGDTGTAQAPRAARARGEP